MPEKKKNSTTIIVIVIVALIVLCGLCGGGLLLLSKGDNLFDSVKNALKTDPSEDPEGSISINEIYDLDLSGEQEIKVYGTFQSSSYLEDTFTLLNNEDSLSVKYQNMSDKSLSDVDISSFIDGDYVIVTGIYDSESWSLYAKKISKTTAEAIDEYKESLLPHLKIEVLDYPKTVTHVCKNFAVKLKLTNDGTIPVNYDDFYYNNGDYMIMYSLNESSPIGSYIIDTETNEIELGIADFGTLEPGKSVEIDFLGGGNVTQSVDPTWLDDDGSPHVVGIAGEMNLLYDNVAKAGKKGANTVQFHWVKIHDSSNYDITFSNPLIIDSSEEISINLSSTECDMDDIQDTYVIKN